MQTRTDWGTDALPEGGDCVVTIDEKHLGTVGATRGPYFTVHVRWGRDYWLSVDLIRQCEPGRVVLHVSRDVVSRYRRRDRGAVSAGMRPAAQPATRITMEEEL